MAETDTKPNQHANANTASRRLRNALKHALTPVEKAIVFMHYSDGLTFQQIAERLGITVPRVIELYDALNLRMRVVNQRQQRESRIARHDAKRRKGAQHG